MTQVSIVIISKNENSLADTLVSLARMESVVSHDVVVVDASTDGMAALRADHPEVDWRSYQGQPGSTKSVTIPEQRNAGVAAATGDIVVFIDAGCVPRPGWLETLTAPLLDGTELVTVGSFCSTNRSPYDSIVFTDGYVSEAPTLNMAFVKSAFDKVGGFDESFSYCSDTDFCWRLVKAGVKIRMIADAGIVVDWGGGRRQSRRARLYGAGRARLYLKHTDRLTSMLRHDPVLVVYPAFLLGLPLTLLFPFYPLLLLVPLWRSRRTQPVRTLMDHLWYGAGAIAYLVRLSP